MPLAKRDSHFPSFSLHGLRLNPMNPGTRRTRTRKGPRTSTMKETRARARTRRRRKTIPKQRRPNQNSKGLPPRLLKHRPINRNDNGETVPPPPYPIRAGAGEGAEVGATETATKDGNEGEDGPLPIPPTPPIPTPREDPDHLRRLLHHDRHVPVVVHPIQVGG